MRIASLETLHADAGWRSFDFVNPDMVPWQDELVTVTPRIDAGHLALPTGPGWAPRWTRRPSARTRRAPADRRRRRRFSRGSRRRRAPR